VGDRGARPRDAPIHDWELLENGNRLILVAIPREVPALGPYIVGDQGIYDVAPDGRIMWQ
jgi:hypothetical protein